MGNVMSSRAWRGTDYPSDTRSKLTDAREPTAPAPLFLDEMDPTTAPWSHASRCATIQRFFGWLPDSMAEKLKQGQATPLYVPRAVVRAVGVAPSRDEAWVVIVRMYRRYSARQKWYLVSAQVLEIARQQLIDRASAEDDESMLASFRQILSSGFSAQKVSITGVLKNVQLHLVRNADQQECYLTWTPSRKRQPRIHLHDVEEVVAVLKDGNKHAPRLANKVSHRRGLVIVCKSHHRGRIVLQMNSKRERKVLLLGFQKLLEELNGFAPTLDDEGAIRKRLPRRLSAVQFFDENELRGSQDMEQAEPSETNDKETNDNEKDEKESTSTSSERGDKPVDETRTATPITEPAQLPSSPASPSAKAKITRRQSMSMERVYQTRFDESPTAAIVTGPTATTTPQDTAPDSDTTPLTPTKPKKPSFMRRSSLVT